MAAIVCPIRLVEQVELRYREDRVNVGNDDVQAVYAGFQNQLAFGLGLVEPDVDAQGLPWWWQ